jgi:polyphosphate glucokinase
MDMSDVDAGPGHVALGVDVGGTEIKAGRVDLHAGTLVGPRRSARTPGPATPAAIARTIRRLVADFEIPQTVGVAYPGVVVDGIARTSVNLHPAWLGARVDEAIGDALGTRVVTVNDADAAGLAEARYGAARGHDGLAVTVTFGTGIGTALLNRGQLVANSELGHLELDGRDAEQFAAASVIQREGLSWPQWAERANRYLFVLERLLWPSLIVIGGGVSTSPEKWLQHLNARAQIVPAQLTNNAGIIGAALAAATQPTAPA